VWWLLRGPSHRESLPHDGKQRVREGEWIYYYYPPMGGPGRLIHVVKNITGPRV